MWKKLLFAATMLLLSSPVLAQQSLLKDPGYVDMAPFEEWFDAEPKVFVNIQGALLKMVAEASRYDDPELTRLLLDLKAIQVRGYALSPSRIDKIQGKNSEIARKLEAKGWETVVRVRDDEELVDMYIRSAPNNTIAGMMVMVVDFSDEESYFINIVGDIDPEQIGRIGRKFNIRSLQDVTMGY